MWLGNISQNGMRMLSKKQKIPSLKLTDLEVCTHCLASKQHRVAFKSFSPSRKANMLDLVHINICSMDATSLGGALIILPLLIIILERYGLML